MDLKYSNFLINYGYESCFNISKTINAVPKKTLGYVALTQQYIFRQVSWLDTYLMDCVVCM